MKSAREIALEVLLDIDKNGTFSNIALAKALRVNQFEDKKLRAFVSRLVEGVVEYRLQLDVILEKHKKKDAKKERPIVTAILRMGVYQIMYMDSVPARAAINESVKLVKDHGMGQVSGYVNGLLRSIAADKENISFVNISERYSTPKWICRYIKQLYGAENAEKIIGSQFAERGTTIRVNTVKQSKEALKEKLIEKGVAVSDGRYTDVSLIIDNYDFIRKLPGFREGEFSVQDESSTYTVMRAYEMTEFGEEPFVIDMCAAPGGKSLCIAERLMNKGEILSCDISDDKVELIRENASRLGLTSVKPAVKDATVLDEGLVEKADLVISDVPCTGLGIMGRKNDIKYRVEKADIETLSQLGYSIMTNAARYVKRGGTLLYSTCTITKKENEENVQRFLEEHKDFVKLEDRLFLQGIDGTDGFFYSIFKKKE